MRKRSLLRVLVACILVVVGLGGGALLAIASVAVLNSDLYGRLTETVPVVTPLSPTDGSTEAPTVRVVLHRVLSDENAVEASIVLVVADDPDLRQAIESGTIAFTAEVMDGQGVDSPAIIHRLTLDRSSLTPGLRDVAIQSERFLLPTLPSQYGFPFDDLRIRPVLDVILANGAAVRFHTEIQKALPGRRVGVTESGGLPEIILTRPLTEKFVVAAGAIVFLSISVLVIAGLLGTSLSRVEEIVAIAGFLLATAGIRDLLGLTRTAGTSAVEVLVVGVPLVLLAIAFGVSTIRGYLETQRVRATSSPGMTAEE